MNDDNTYRHPWLGVELRHLATLSAVARTRSFRHAAHELGYVQSAVSQQIARLENVVGARLVERRRGQRTVTLTRAGDVLARRGERILSELHAARTDLAVVADSGHRTIRLAVASDSAPLLAELLAAIRGSVPSTRIELIEIADDRRLARALENGDADVAVGVALTAPSVGSVVLLHDPFVVLARHDSPIAALTSVSSPADLADERLLVPASLHSHAPLHAPGLPLESALCVPLAAVIPTLVARGHGIGLIPRSSLDCITPDLAVIPTTGLIAPQRLLLAWHAARRRTTQLEAFCNAAVRAFDTGATGQPQAA